MQGSGRQFLPLVATLAVAGLILTVASCGSGGALRAYHAYGDSITAGFTLSDPALAYPTLLARDRTYVLERYALAGDQACDVPTRQIAPHGEDDAEPRESRLYSLLIGTNDADVRGPGPYEGVFNLCEQASIAWLGVPAAGKVHVDAAQVTTSGPGSFERFGRWPLWRTVGAGSSITLPIDLQATGAVYLWFHMVDGDAGIFSVALDGVLVRSVATGPTPTIATQNGSHDSMGLVRIPGVSPGAKQVTLVQTSTAGSMEIIAIGTPAGLSAGAQIDAGTDAGAGGVPLPPTVLVGDTPRQRLGSPAPCTLDPARCDAFSADTRANVALLAGDGLDVRLAANHLYMQGSPEEMSDGLHPNRLGQRELRSAFEAALDSPAR